MYCISQACHAVKMHIGSTLVLPGPNCVSKFCFNFCSQFCIDGPDLLLFSSCGPLDKNLVFGLQLQRQIWIGFHITCQFGNFVRSPLGDVLCYLGLSFSHNEHWVCFGSTWAQFCFQICFHYWYCWPGLLVIQFVRASRQETGFRIAATASDLNWISFHVSIRQFSQESTWWATACLYS